jgi:capsular polysaccharide biosynthesis protein
MLFVRQERQMPLAQYARVLWKRGWIILLLAALTTLSAIAFSKLQTPIYKSSVSLSVYPARPSDYGQTLAIKNLLRLYVRQLQSPFITQQVIDKLQLDVTTEKFLTYVNFSADEADLVINIEARHPLTANAPKIAQTLSEIFLSFHNQENLQIDQRDRILVNLLNNATSPELFSPKTSINAVAGAILGALIGVLVLFALEWFESDVVRTTEDVERYIGVPALGLIPTMTNGTEREASSRRAVGAKTAAKPAISD